jgi:2-amino-4-hydroxy-6-hydroxymethyldihydropteridine diphosphokinase
MIYHLLLGSNIEDPIRQIAIATQRIAETFTLIRESSLQKSKAYGKTDQPDFYNKVLEIDSALDPQCMMRELLSLETALGRIREGKWGPRKIDIDILLAQDLVIDSPDLKIPHYDLHNRAFALRLLCELVPEAVHPIYNKTMRKLFEELARRK